MKLTEAFGIKRGEVISLVGGGGKTSLMYAIAHETAAYEAVITTTTTKIAEPSSGDTPLLIVEPDEERMVEKVVESLGRYRHITLVSERLDSGRLRGISPELVGRIAGMNLAFCIIVEADGAGQRPLKAPIEKEPVIPRSTSLVIPVVGVEAVGIRLTEKDVFRVETVSKLLGLPIGSIVSAENIARLIIHRLGMTKGSPSTARIIPFINKMDLDGAGEKGRRLAEAILTAGHSQIHRVVLGQARLPDPVVDVVLKS